MGIILYLSKCWNLNHFVINIYYLYHSWIKRRGFFCILNKSILQFCVVNVYIQLLAIWIFVTDFLACSFI